MAVKPRYFCENCGSEVDRGASSCPTCGSRFTAVRCPKCGYEGREGEFRSGCPVCGYMVPQASPRAGSAPPARPKRRATLLPRWFYSVAAIALLAAVVVLLAVILVKG
jgi:uncharacterized membrane protein YvbJ